MLTGNEFINVAKHSFSFLKSEFGMETEKIIIRSNVFYAIRYSNSFILISISYENIDDYFNIQLIKKIYGKISHYDDLNNSMNLTSLNRLIMEKIKNDELVENQKKIILHTTDNFEKRILRDAIKLQFCLRNIDLIWNEES